MIRKTLLSLAAAALVGGQALAPEARADAIADFYKQNRVTIIVGFTPGGGYDAYARLVARYIGDHVPGKPQILVQNMPGASSLTAVRYILEIAPQNGTQMVAFNPGLIAPALADREKAPVDFSRMRFVGSATSDVRVCYYWHETGIRSLEDLFARDEVIMGATAAGSNSYINGRLLANLFGANIRHITGYPGSAEQRIAIERGELHGDCGAWGSVPANWLENNLVVPIVRFSSAEVPGMPPLPYILDRAKSQEDRQILNLILSSAEVGRPFGMGPNVPEDRLGALRTGFDAMIKDSAFLEEAERTRREIIGPMSGAEVEAAIRDLYATPREVVMRAVEVIK